MGRQSAAPPPANPVNLQRPVNVTEPRALFAAYGETFTNNRVFRLHCYLEVGYLALFTAATYHGTRPWKPRRAATQPPFFMSLSILALKKFRVAEHLELYNISLPIPGHNFFPS